MDAAVVRQFLDFFQDFLNLCQSDNWPDNDTSEEEIRNAFKVSKHIVICLDKLNDKLETFFTALQNDQELPDSFLKACFADPPKYVLKRIIQSKTNISQMDMGFKIFLELFSKEQLENCLTSLMVETASKETLLRNLSQEIPKEKVLEFKSQIFLSELNHCEDPKEVLLEMFTNLNQNNMTLLVLSLLNKEIKYHKSVNSIVNAFVEVTSRKNYNYKSLWKYLFNIDDKSLVKLCLEHADLFKLTVRALADCGRLLKENMSSEYFYIDLTYSQLVGVVQRICKDDNLKIEFFDIIGDADLAFWENML